MNKTIYCVCGLHLGELAPGSKIKKETVFLCVSCNTKRLASDLASKTTANPFSDWGGIFGDTFKKR